MIRDATEIRHPPGEAGAHPLACLLPLRRHLSVVHHVPGRLRVRVSRRALSRSDGMTAGAFRRAIEAVAGVEGLRMSPATLSAVVEYDPDRLVPELWDLLLGGPDDGALAAFEQLTQTA